MGQRGIPHWTFGDERIIDTIVDIRDQRRNKRQENRRENVKRNKGRKKNKTKKEGDREAGWSLPQYTPKAPTLALTHDENERKQNYFTIV